jgi:hypothetical protein
VRQFQILQAEYDRLDAIVTDAEERRRIVGEEHRRLYARLLAARKGGDT